MGAAHRPLPDGSITGSQIRDRSVHLTFVGADEVALPFEWLRDQCPCADCRIRQTDERRLRPWLIEPAAAIAVSVVDGAAEVIWADGHRSVYDSAWIDGVNRALRRGSYTATLWHAGYELGRFDHDAVVADPVGRSELFRRLAQDGAAIITGAPRVPGTVVEFMRAIGLTLLDSPLGFIFDVRLDPAGFNVAYTHEALPLHNDNAQYQFPPSGQVLSMVTNDVTGGESQVADGWCILEQLRRDDPGAIDVLSRVLVGFRQYSSESDGFNRAPLVVRDPLGRFTHLRFSNQLMQPLAYDHPDVDEWYRAYRKLGEIIHRPENRVEFRLEGGQMLMVNGCRILHARNAFVPDGPRHLQDVYYSSQDVLDNLAYLVGDAVDGMVHA